MKKTASATPKHPSHPTTPKAPPKKRFVFGALPAPGTATLATLPAVFGDVDEVSRTLLFRDADDSDLVDDGTKVETSTILDSIPTFLVSCAGILGSLTVEQEGLVYLDPGIFGVLVDETGKLVVEKKRHDDALRAEKSGHVAQETGVSALAHEGALLRERTRAALISALGSSRRTLIDTAAGTATEDPAAVATALDALADLLDAVHDPEAKSWTAADRASTDRFCVGSAQVDVLRADAESVRAASAVPAKPTRTASQRSLDLQDGRVLLLVEQIVRAFRQAHRASTAIAMPDLKQIAWKFSSRSGKRAKKAIKAPAETLVTTRGASELEVAQAALAAANKAVAEAAATVSALESKGK
jgi:hypothetical protein